MATDINILSRRETLVGIALCGAIAVTPVAAATIAKVNRQPDRSEWDRTMTAWLAAGEEHDRLHRIYDQAFHRWHATRPDRSKLCLRKMTPAFHQLSADEIDYDLNTADFYARYCAAQGVTRWSRDEAGSRAAIKAELDAIDAYRAEAAAARNFSGIDQALSAVDEAEDLLTELHDKLIEMPAPDASALLFKLEWFMDDTLYDDEHVAQTKSDMRRLLANGRAAA